MKTKLFIAVVGIIILSAITFATVTNRAPRNALFIDNIEALSQSEGSSSLCKRAAGFCLDKSSNIEIRNAIPNAMGIN